MALPPLTVRTAAWLVRDAQPVLGERHLAILEAVRDHGSLNAAAKALRISYRDAWQKIRRAEAILGCGLIAATIGGRRGGGSRLTVVGEEIIARLRAFHAEERDGAARAAAHFFGGATGGRAKRRAGERLVLATTTSLVDSGLLAALLPPFAGRMGVEVEVLPVGSGAALRRARDGQADVVVTHAPAAERRIESAGDVINRRALMTNDFVLVGPATDPGGVRRARDVIEALRRIAQAFVPFLSRADDSGTNQCERALLRAARVATGSWYVRHPGGMADLLRAAGAMGAYALTDRGTMAALAGEVSLEELFSGDARLRNAYSVFAVNPYRHAGINYVPAMDLIGWLTAPAAQELIGAYRVRGQRVAAPTAAGNGARQGRKSTRA